MARRSSGDDGLLELDDVERRLKPFARRYVGVRPIPIARIVGTENVLPGRVVRAERRTGHWFTLRSHSGKQRNTRCALTGPRTPAPRLSGRQHHS